MRKLQILSAMLMLGLFLSLSAADSQAFVHKKKDTKKIALDLCIKEGIKPCKKAAAKQCRKKSGLKKEACIKASIKACEAGVEKACKEKM